MFLASLAFVLGFSCVFVALGASASSIGAILNEKVKILTRIAGVAVILFGQTRSFALGFALLFVSGLMQSLCLTPLAAVMLRGSSPEMRGRVMGMRVLAVWGLPLGLLATGPLIAHLGFLACTTLYGSLGLAATVAVGYRCRDDLWSRAAPANSHA